MTIYSSSDITLRFHICLIVSIDRRRLHEVRGVALGLGILHSLVKVVLAFLVGLAVQLEVADEMDLFLHEVGLDAAS